MIAAIGVALSISTTSCGTTTQGASSQSTPPTTRADGSALYQAHCASCHGADLRGTDKGPSHLSKIYEPSHHSDAAFRAAIANGSRQHHWNFGDMPPVPGLRPDEVEAIISFVRAMQRDQGFEPYPPR